ERMFLRSGLDVLNSIIAPLLVLIYAFPVSIGLTWSLKIAHRLPTQSPERNRIRAIAATIVASLLIGVFAGITNPRYSYVSMPLLAVLLGAAAAIEWDNDHLRPASNRLAKALKSCCILWIVAHLILTVVAFKKIAQIDPREHVETPRALLIAAAAASLMIGMGGVL